MAAPPTVSGFLAFIRNVMGINVTALPDTEPAIQDAFDLAIATVNLTLNVVPIVYTLAVYNLAGDQLINWAPDQPSQKFFRDLRAELKISAFAAGVVASSGDDGTNVSLATPDYMKQLTLSDLQNLKTPYGRAYLAAAQKYGPGAWGVA